MKTLKLKKIVAVAVAAIGLAAVAAPKVTIDKIEDGDVWSTKKVTYTVSDLSDEPGEYKYNLAFDVTAYSVTTNIKMGVAQNGTFTETLDTAAIFGETRKDPKARFRVALEKGEQIPLPGVQLWENGPYFAEYNVGASAPEEYGYYFWWGDTVGYKRNSSNNGWVSVADGTTAIKFSSSDPTATQTYEKDAATLKSLGFIDDVDDPVLNAAHDAARAHLGKPWRMMTKDELDKLLDTSYCTRTWVTSYNGKSVSGYVVKGKAGSAYENNEVFFPAAGCGSVASLNTAGSDGYCWSSTPYSDSSSASSAWYLGFYSSKFYADGNVRYRGQSVRPVRGFAE